MNTNNTVIPPFTDGSEVVCTRNSFEIDYDGRLIGNCECTKDSEYIIDGCVWSWKSGWSVSITGELHDARDFVAKGQEIKG